MKYEKNPTVLLLQKRKIHMHTYIGRHSQLPITTSLSMYVTGHVDNSQCEFVSDVLGLTKFSKKHNEAALLKDNYSRPSSVRLLNCSYRSSSLKTGQAFIREGDDPPPDS